MNKEIIELFEMRSGFIIYLKNLARIDESKIIFFIGEWKGTLFRLCNF